MAALAMRPAEGPACSVMEWRRAGTLARVFISGSVDPGAKACATCAHATRTSTAATCYRQGNEREREASKPELKTTLAHWDKESADRIARRSKTYASSPGTGASGD
jgi:hypothetical protein